MSYGANVAAYCQQREAASRRIYTGLEPASEYTHSPNHPYWTARLEKIYLPKLRALATVDERLAFAATIPDDISPMAECSLVQKEITRREQAGQVVDNVPDPQ